MPVTHCVPAGTPWAANQIVVPGLNAMTTYVSDVPSGGRRGRCIYFPSSAATNAQAQGLIKYPGQTGVTDPIATGLATWVTNMNNYGFQVVSCDNIETYTGTNQWVLEVSNDAANGTRGLQTCLHHWDHILDWCNKNAPGGAMPTMVAGLSFGAWVALQIALNRPSQVIGCIGRSSPTRWNDYPTAFNQFAYDAFSGVNTSGINLGSNPTVNCTALSSNGSSLTATVSATAGSGITTSTYVTINDSLNHTADGSYLPTSVTATTVVVPTSLASGSYFYSGVPSSTHSGQTMTTNVSTNAALNNLTVPTVALWGDTNELVNHYELNTMYQNAIANSNAEISFYQMTGEGHVWYAADTTNICGTSSGWVQNNFTNTNYPKNY